MEKTYWGIDIGSRSIEMLGIKEDGTIASYEFLPTTYDPLKQIRSIVNSLKRLDPLVATGYGRKLFMENIEWWGPKKTITEIQAYALGAKKIAPHARTVIDIGGQDTKVIALDEEGRVVRFEMNDRCAAGTGKFLEFMATALQVGIKEFGEFALLSKKNLTINNMCTVFAESEATSMMAKGENAEDIAKALHVSVVNRTMAMARRVGITLPVLFGGGVARNKCIKILIEEILKQPIIVPEKPESVGALGAAVYAWKNLNGAESR